MLERDMEDLIAAYPQDFFPRKELKLIGRQESFMGVGRYDLLFEDEHKTKILMELKSRSAKYEDASQLAKYKEALEKLGARRIIMWLIATQVQKHVREFLDSIGIEYSEIHENEYRDVATRYSQVLSEAEAEFHPTVDTNSVQSNNLTSSNFGTGKSKYHKDFRAKLENLAILFKTAYMFFVYPRNNPTKIWFRTVKNAHLYCDDYFLSYILVYNDRLEFCPRFNHIIEVGTQDRSSLLFSSCFEEIIKNHKGYEKGWAARSGENYVIKHKAPESFFNELINSIEKLKP